MKSMTYDHEVGAAYFYFKGEPGQSVYRTVSVDRNVNVDLDEDGSVFGVELLSVDRSLPFGNLILFVDRLVEGKSWEKSPKIVGLTDLELSQVEEGHGCGRDDCGVKRDPGSGVLYWARLVCGHGIWPCPDTCSYPIHAAGQCPGAGPKH
jgi:uncharacterized protein YuzE